MQSANVESQTFDGLVEWGVGGGYFKILTAASACRVELFRGGNLVLLAPSVRAGFYQRVAFDKVRITNSGSQAIEFLTAPDEGGSDAFTANSVITSPLDADNADAKAALGAAGLVATLGRLLGYNGATWDRLRADNEGAGVGALRVARFGDAITRAATAFLGYGFQGLSAGNFAAVQLKNPAASGKLVYVDRISGAGGGVAGKMGLYRHDVDLATAIGAAANKDLGGAASSALLKKITGAALVGTVIAERRVDANGASGGYEFVFNPPLRLGEGEGLVVQLNTVSSDVDAAFEFREYAA